MDGFIAINDNHYRLGRWKRSADVESEETIKTSGE
jgi:hypothetical protein